MQERKEDLAARMRLVKAALDSEPVAVAILKAPELRYLYANAEMRRLAGQDLTGRLHTDAWPVNALERLTSIMREVAETGEPWIDRDAPWDLPRVPGGAAEHMFLTMEVTRVDLGEGAYLLLTITETTDEVVMRQQRDTMSERMADVLESVSDVIMGLDEQFCITYANRHMAELCLTRAEELLGVDLCGALPSACGTPFEQACRDALASRERVRLEADGPPFGGAYVARIYPSDTGVVVYVADTTERAKMRQALERANHRFDAILDGTSDGFWIVDRDMRFVHANRTVADSLRVRREDLIGRSALEVFGGDVGGGLQRRFIRALETGRRDDFTTSYAGRWYEVRLVPVGDELATFVRDVTDQRDQQRITEEQARYSGVLNAIDADINATLDYDSIMSRMIVRASEAMEADFSFVVMLEDEGWRVTHAYGNKDLPVGTMFTQKDLGHASLALESRQTVVIEDSVEDPRVDRSLAEAIGIGPMVAVPLQRGNEVFGALLFNRGRRAGPFSAEMVEFATMVGYHVSLAVENAWLLEREREARLRAADQAQMANLLLVAAENLSASLSLEDVTMTLQALVSRSTGRSRITVLRRSEEAALEVLTTTCEMNSSDARQYLSLLYSPVLGEVFEGGRPQIVDFDNGDELPDDLREVAARCRLRCVLFVPIRYGAAVLGALAVDEPGSNEPFSARDVDTVSGLAAQAATAIENARLYESLEETARYSESLNEIDVGINSSFDFDTVMRRTLRLASETLESDGAMVGMAEGDRRWLITHAYGEEANDAGHALTFEELPHAHIAAHTCKPVVVDDTSVDPRVARDRMQLRDIRSLLAVPLLRGEGAIGVLFFNRHRRARAFSAAQIDFARKLAAHVSLAVHNSRLYQAQREIADTLQEALLVMPERVEGLEFAQLYRSAAEAARVGGDFYDLFSIDDHTAGVVIGDVSGKGLDAAVMTSLARNTIRAYSAERMAPASVIERAGDIVLASSERWVFMSVFYGVIDFETHVMSYCNAGHPAPVIISPSGRLTMLESTAPLAGAFKGTVYGQAHCRLEPGDTVVFYTDGVIEARSNGELYGEERLHEVLARSAGLDLDDLVDRVVDEAERFAKSLRDDVAVLAVRVLGR